MKITVVNEHDTLSALIDRRCSIARFGDGEYKNARGGKCKPQESNQKLAGRLREILVSDTDKCLIAIPNIYDGIHSAQQKAREFWEAVATRKKYNSMLRPDKTYYSSFVTRPDNAPSIDNDEYYDRWKSLWKDREMVFVSGVAQPCKLPEFFGSGRFIAHVKTPLVSAYSEYARILSECLSHDDGVLYILRTGPTATVLAYDLAMAGRQAIDIGHLPMFYARFKARCLKEEALDYDNSRTSYDA